MSFNIVGSNSVIVFEGITCRSPERQEVLERRSSLKGMVLSLLRELGAPVLSVEVRYDRDLGLYILAVLDCDARQALEYWLRIADLVSALRIPVFIAWLGHTDVEPEEMGSYLGRILTRMSVSPATREPIDIARILREEWGI